MKNNKTITEGGNYITPLCVLTVISQEGVLCSSIEGLGGTFDYVWGEDEE